MARRPPPAGDPTAGPDAAGVRTCPRCGADLFILEVSRGARGPARATYCAGLYDRDRRRFVRRSCGYSVAPAEPAAGDGALLGPGRGGAVAGPCVELA
jgi:hypothetical protein